jgi:hypothetical protein
MGDETTLVAELTDIFHHAQEKMHDDNYFLDHSLDLTLDMMSMPAFTLHLNVPKLPGANTHLLTKMPEPLQV